MQTVPDREDWGTPQPLFDKLNAEFGFDLDVAASHNNAKCATYYTEAEDGLTLPWTGTVWCNPPYGKQIANWIRKGYEAALSGATVVYLIPSRTDAGWWHEYVWDNVNNRPKPWAEVRFIPKRVKYAGAKYNAPFPSAVVIFRPPHNVEEESA